MVSATRGEREWQSQGKIRQTITVRVVIQMPITMGMSKDMNVQCRRVCLELGMFCILVTLDC